MTDEDRDGSSDVVSCLAASLDERGHESEAEMLRYQKAEIERLRAALRRARERFDMLARGHAGASAEAGAQDAWEALGGN